MSQYATIADFTNVGLPAKALANFEPAVIDDHLQKASGRIDSYLPAQYKLPLTAPYPDVLKEVTCILAAYSLLTVLGRNPDSFDTGFQDRYLDIVGTTGKLGWLDKLSKGSVQLPGVLDTTPSENEGAPRVSSRASRGWYASDGTDDDRV